MSVRTFVDTNVLVYAFDDADPGKKERALQVLAMGAQGALVLSPQVLQEFYVTVTRKLAKPLEPAIAERAVQHLARLPSVPADASLVVEAVALHRRYALSLWDALVVQSALRGGCSRILTEDLQAGLRIGELLVENPFADVQGKS